MRYAKEQSDANNVAQTIGKLLRLGVYDPTFNEERGEWELTFW